MANPGNRSAVMGEQTARQLDWISIHPWRYNALVNSHVALFLPVQIHLADRWLSGIFLPE